MLDVLPFIGDRVVASKWVLGVRVRVGGHSQGSAADRGGQPRGAVLSRHSGEGQRTPPVVLLSPQRPCCQATRCSSVSSVGASCWRVCCCRADLSRRAWPGLQVVLAAMGIDISKEDRTSLDVAMLSINLAGLVAGMPLPITGMLMTKRPGLRRYVRGQQRVATDDKGHCCIFSSTIGCYVNMIRVSVACAHGLAGPSGADSGSSCACWCRFWLAYSLLLPLALAQPVANMVIYNRL